MEREKYVLAFLLILTTGAFNSGTSWKKNIYSAYISNNMEDWRQTIDQMEKIKLDSAEFLSQLINYQYGYIGWCIGNENNSRARFYLKLAERNLEAYSRHATASEIHAYESAFYGYKIGMNRLMAPVYGPRSIKKALLAIEEDEGNPMGYIQYGNSQFYMPSVFGGSKSEAIEYYQKAQELMERNQAMLHENWNYLNLLTVIAQAFESTGNPDEALKYYEKILQIEPQFLWVKDELYPQLINKL